jgi:hypothetical protein
VDRTPRLPPGPSVNLSKSVELRALAGQLTTFAEQVRAGLDQLDWYGQRQWIRTLVSRIELDEQGATIIYRIPGIPRPPGVPDPGAADAPLSIASKGPARHESGGGEISAVEEWPRSAQETRAAP